MKRVLTIAIGLAIAISAGVFLDHEVNKRVVAQSKGSITGEVYVRQNEDGNASMLFSVFNECPKKRQDCEKQPFDKVTVTLKDWEKLQIPGLPEFPKFEDSDEYKDFLRYIAEKNKRGENKAPKENFYFPFLNWNGQGDANAPDSPFGSYNSFYQNSWDETAEIRKKDLVLKFSGKYSKDDFEQPEEPSKKDEIGHRNLSDMEVKAVFKDQNFPYKVKIVAEILAEFQGRVVAKKKVKVQELPKIEVKKVKAAWSDLPNILTPGKPAFAVLDDKSYINNLLNQLPPAQPQDNKNEPDDKIDLSGMKLHFFTGGIQVDGGGGDDTLTIDDNTKKPMGVKPLPPKNPEPMGDDRAADNSRTTVGPITSDKKTVFEALPSKDAKPGDRAGVEIRDKFGDKLGEIVFPEIKIDEPGKKGDKPIPIEDLEQSDRIDDPSGKEEKVPVEEDDETDDAGSDDCSLKLADASSYVLEGRRMCVCGCFFNNELDWWEVGNIFGFDGNPFFPLALSQKTAVFEIPEGTPPGKHRFTFKPAGGVPKTVEITIMAVQGTIDQNRLWTGQGTTMTLRVLGTEEPMPLLLENKTPAIIGISGGDRQIVNTSGGAINQVERQVLGMSRGNFTIDYSLDQPACPCFK